MSCKSTGMEMRRTLQQIAASQGYDDIVQQLLNSNVKVNSQCISR